MLRSKASPAFLWGLCCSLAVSLLLFGCKGGGRGNIGPGQPAPDFSSTTLNGEVKRLSDFRGKLVLLNFWASWCEPCREEIPALERLQSRLHSEGVAVVSVGVDDTREALLEIASKYGVSYTVFVDLEGELKRRYGVSGIPESFVLQRDGTFALFDDPSSGPTVTIVGPREWDSPEMIERLRRLAKR